MTGFANEPWTTLLDAPALRITRNPADGRLCIRFHDGCEFRMNARGTSVDVHWTDPCTDRDAMAYAMGSVFALLLRFQGRVALHASAVETSRGTILLCASSGVGKSTLAAAFARRGAFIVTDDVAVVAPLGNGFVTYRAGNGVRLWPETAAKLLGSRSAGTVVAPCWPKHHYALTGHPRASWSEPLPVRALLLPMRPGTPGVHRLAPRTALERLARQLQPDIRVQLPEGFHAQAFPLLSHAAASLPIAELGVADDLDQLDQVCERVEKWLDVIDATHPAAST